MSAPLTDALVGTRALVPVERPPRKDPAWRILVLAPIRNDGRLTVEFLTKDDLDAVLCTDIADLCRELEVGCGALVLGEEALGNGGSHLLARKLEAQPWWSHLPVIIITGMNDGSTRRSLLGAVGPVGNVSIIERPVRPGTLVSAVRFALGSRGRQYQVRTLIKEREMMTERLQESDRRKDEFLAMLAHELRNPLASVANAAELLRTSNEPECHEWAAKVIERQTSQLAHLIDDLLDVSRITMGKIRLHKQRVDVAALLDRACETVRTAAHGRRHELVCDYSHGHIWIDADPTRVEQIVGNLLTNAIKYTPPGGRIEITARQMAEEILISVRDNGIGIRREFLPEIFQLFIQGERSIARSEGGLGIGLTVVQKLAELHGGSVEAHSEGPGLGSTFSVRLPATTPPAQTTRAPEDTRPKDSKSLCVLIVDDNIDSAHGLERLLSLAGHQTVLAYDGLHALEQAEAHRPGVIVLDIGLPGMDGFEVARKLRATPAIGDALIIGVTGYGQEEDRRRSLAAGFDHHLVKPVDLKELKRLIADFSLQGRLVSDAASMSGGSSQVVYH